MSDVPSPPPTPYAIKAQWDILQKHLKSLPAIELPRTDPAWLDLISHSVLNTALEKETTKIKSLQNQVSQRKTRTEQLSHFCSLQFPNYDVGNARSSYPSPTPATEGRPERIPAKRFPDIDVDFDSRPPLYISLPGTATRHSALEPLQQYPRPSPLSPLSPTFGPRMGHVPIGTFERRRSLQYPLPTNAHTTRAADAHRQGEGNVNKESAKIMWEAAWLWIENHIEEYTERFEDSNQDGIRDKYEVWEKLVRLRIEGEDLDRQLTSISEDVKG